MLVILLAPSVAAVTDLLRERYSLSRTLIYLVAAIITFPPVVVWLSGYSFNSNQLDYIASAFCITGILLALMTYSDGEPGGKMKATLVITIFTGLVVGILFFASLFTGKDKIYGKATYKNYIGIHSGDFDQVVHGLERVTIRKTKVFGLIEKTIITQRLDKKDTVKQCNFPFSDKEQAFNYNYCNNSIAEADGAN